MSQTILIIDDFASVRLYHVSYLTRKGFTCLCANDGREALSKLAATHVDLILLDMVMPGMGGDEFVTHLDALSTMTTTPVLVITSEEASARSKFATCNRRIGVLGKPVLPELLLQEVRRLLPPVLLSIAS